MNKQNTNQQMMKTNQPVKYDYQFKFEFPAACWSDTDLSANVVWRKSRLSGQHEMNSNKVLDPEDKPSGVS